MARSHPLSACHPSELTHQWTALTDILATACWGERKLSNLPWISSLDRKSATDLRWARSIAGSCKHEAAGEPCALESSEGWTVNGDNGREHSDVHGEENDWLPSSSGPTQANTSPSVAIVTCNSLHVQVILGRPSDRGLTTGIYHLLKGQAFWCQNNSNMCWTPLTKNPKSEIIPNMRLFFFRANVTWLHLGSILDCGNDSTTYWRSQGLGTGHRF